MPVCGRNGADSSGKSAFFRIQPGLIGRYWDKTKERKEVRVLGQWRVKSVETVGVDEEMLRTVGRFGLESAISQGERM